MITNKGIDMKVELEFGTSLCYMPTFIINGIDAESSDFGEQYDRNSQIAEDYGCGDMQFTRIDPTEDVLEKYGITEVEYFNIAEKLEEGLSFGNCGWCI